MSNIAPDALLNEFSQMRNTIRGLLDLIKKQDACIKEQEARTKEQDAHIKEQEARINEIEDTLASMPTVSQEDAVLDRYTTSSKLNRSVNAQPIAIALAAHLLYVKHIPAMRISESGLLSQSKMHGLSQWSRQHLLDFCVVNNVKDVYLNGLGEAEARKLMPHYDLYQAYIEKIRNEHK